MANQPGSSTAVAADSKQLSRQERQLCRQKRKELDLITKRLNSQTELKLKFILVGNSAVGKTSLIQKFVDDKADIRTTQVTMLCDFHHCMVSLCGRTVQIRIWDTGGMERFHDKNLTSSFYRKSDGVLMVFSVDDMDSFLALPRWLDRVRENMGPTSQFDCCIVGNKSDRSERRLVSRRDAEQFANRHGFPYIETSALDSVNVQKAFNDVALAAIRRHQIMQQVETAAATSATEKSFGLFRQSRSGGGSSDKGCGCS